MKPSSTALSMAIATSLGISFSMIETASAVALPDGEYDLIIKTTPVTTTSGGNTQFNVGVDGNWNSSFTFGNIPGSASNGMTDTAATVTNSDGYVRGSGTGGDGFAGILRIDVGTNTFSTLSFSKDLVFNTAGGDFAQFVESPTLIGDTSQFIGTIDKSSGSMTLQPTGRYGAISAPNNLFDRKWQVDDFNFPGNTAWDTFTTGESATGTKGSINGRPFFNVGDQNGDNIDDVRAVLVSGGNIGSDWDSFLGAAFYETWKVELYARAIDDTSTATTSSQAVITVLKNDGTGGTGGGTSQLTVVSTTDGILGTTTITGSGTTVTYSAGATPGSDSFTYTTQDGNGVQSSATVKINVTDNPVAAGDDGPFELNQGVATAIAVSDLTSNDSSTAGAIDDATLTPVSPTSAGGTVTVSGANITYTPPSVSFVGADSFTYTVKDDAVPPNTSDPANVTMSVLAYGLTDVGSYEPGDIALAAGSRDGSISSDELPPDAAVESSCTGGCFNFDVTGIGMATAAQIVTPPLSIPIVEGLTMRKFINKRWQDFDTTTDAIASASLTMDGGCPDTASGSWVSFDGATSTAANFGHVCLKYTIANDGANDSNTTDPGVISDPSGLATPLVANGTSPLLKDISDSGCTIREKSNTTLAERADWLLIASFLGMLGWLRRKFINS